MLENLKSLSVLVIALIARLGRLFPSQQTMSLRPPITGNRDTHPSGPPSSSTISTLHLLPKRTSDESLSDKILPKLRHPFGLGGTELFLLGCPIEARSVEDPRRHADDVFIQGRERRDLGAADLAECAPQRLPRLRLVVVVRRDVL